MIAYQSPEGSIRENLADRKVEIHFGDHHFQICITELYLLHRRLSQINIEQYFYNLSDEFDYFKLSLPKFKAAQNLSIPELITLKQLVDQMVYLYELDAILAKNQIAYAQFYYTEEIDILA